MNTPQIVPWYKQFWPWFLICVPLSSMIVGSIMVHFATNTTDSLVVDDYYKEGKAINARLDKIERAAYLNIATEMTIDDEGGISVEFHSGRPQKGDAIKLNFYHVTIEDKDRQVLLTRDANGVYRGFIDKTLEGKWRVTLWPMDEEWKIQHMVYFPKQGPFPFNPS